MRCSVCEASYPVRNGVPILLPSSMQEPGVGNVTPEDPVSRHPYSPSALEIIDGAADGWVLDLGAGGKHQRWDKVVQVDVFRYPMTDVVGTADCLPFKDNAFRAVLSQAVFEHLQFPESAAAEVRRVLQPGGVAKVDTAFLQPEHGYPFHFFNATESGLRHWFREFNIRWSGVESYQHPQWSLSWFLGLYLDRLGVAHAEVLRRSTIGQVLAALNRHAQGLCDEGDEPIITALGALPPHELKTLAAGVSIRVVNPVKAPTGQSVVPEKAHARDGAELVRQQIAFKNSQAEAERLLAREQERWRIALDRGNYLAQFYPDFDSLEHLGLRAWLQFRVASVLRNILPVGLWFHLRSLVKTLREEKPARAQNEGKNRKPFLTVVVDPCNPSPLIDTFFSMVHQTYTDWELILIERPGQISGVRRALRDFGLLDERVRVLRSSCKKADAMAVGCAQARGDFVVSLPEGATLTFNAVATMVTLVRQRPQTSAIVADFEHFAVDDARPMRCHAQGQSFRMAGDSRFVAHRVPISNSEGRSSDEEAAYIPDVLYRHVGKWRTAA